MPALNLTSFLLNFRFKCLQVGFRGREAEEICSQRKMLRRWKRVQMVPSSSSDFNLLLSLAEVKGRCSTGKPKADRPQADRQTEDRYAGKQR